MRFIESQTLLIEIKVFRQGTRGLLKLHSFEAVTEFFRFLVNNFE